MGIKSSVDKLWLAKKGKLLSTIIYTAKYINLFLRFSRSIRTCNIELYIDSIYNICDLFFGLNQPNYARWGLLYVSNLIRLYTRNSPLVTEFRRGAFGVRRTKANFSRSPVDLTLEQTISSDASDELTNNLAVEAISA